MIGWIAKLAMVLSFVTFLGFTIFDWVGAMAGWHDEIWDIVGQPWQDEDPATWTLLFGLVFTLAAVACLAWSYVMAWCIIDGGAMQDFQVLARRLRRLSWGLIGFWSLINLIPIVVVWVLAAGLQAPDNLHAHWEFINIEIVLLIVAITLLAMSEALDRASLIEDENKQFL